MGRVYLNEGWKFTENFSMDILQADIADEKMLSVRLPHTCKELPYNYFDEHEYHHDHDDCGCSGEDRVRDKWMPYKDYNDNDRRDCNCK